MLPKNPPVANNSDDRSIRQGRWLANPAPGEEIVISGISGSFPKSNNVYEFRDNLFNKKDLMDSTSSRWDYEDDTLPPRIGTLDEIEDFDPGFFGIHQRQVTTMDPTLRLTLEKVAEAIFDAGLHPSEFEGSKTCVLTCFCGAEHESSWWWNDIGTESFGLTGYARLMCANRISYWLKLDGVSSNIDTACSSSLTAIDDAYKLLRSGQYDTAIVASAQLITHPYPTMKFHRLGVLSKDGVARCFDDEANGYVRAEAASCVILQKAKNARRIYAQIVHSKANCDGYKEQGITYPSGEAQKVLLREFYEECKVDPASLTYLEAHGTGTVVGDFEELNSIDEIFCQGRSKPLLIGTVKSNMGHSEATSGLASIAKVIVSLESGYIAPNIRFNKPRKGVAGFEKGHFKVVTEKTPIPDDVPLVGMSNFGFGGANVHILLRGYDRKKPNQGQPKDDLPRLVCVSGRTSAAVSTILDDVKSRPLDCEFVGLLQRVFRQDVQTHRYRGYSLVAKSGEITRGSRFLYDDTRKLGLIFGGVDARWLAYGLDLFKIPVFAGVIQRIHDMLLPKGINITESIISEEERFLGCLAVQLGVCEIFRSLDVNPDFVSAVSTGELLMCHFDGTLTLEEILMIGLQCECLFEDVRTKRVEKKQIMNEPKTKESKFANGYGNAPDDAKINNAKNLALNYKEFSHVKILNTIKKILPKPRKRTTTRLSGQELTAEILTHNLLSGNTSDAAVYITEATTVLEVGFDSFQTSTLHFSKGRNGVNVLLDVLGSLYSMGHNFSIENLYPKVDYPVSRGTPMISPLIRWEHSRKAYVKWFENFEGVQSTEYTKTVALTDMNWGFLSGHLIDGRNLFPATGYLHLVWEAASVAAGVNPFNQKVTFEDIKFLRATTCSEDVPLTFNISISKGSHIFELSESDSIVVTGKVFLTKDTQTGTELCLPSLVGTEELSLTEDDVYKELKLRGYNYSGKFRSIRKCDVTGKIAKIQWQDDWISFMDNMLQVVILQQDTRNLYVPTSIHQIVIYAAEHLSFVQKSDPENVLIPVEYYSELDSVRCGAIFINGLEASAISRRRPLGEPVLEKYVFVPNESTTLTTEESVRVNMQIALENNWMIKVKVYELIDDKTREDTQPLSPHILAVFSDQPLIQPDVTILTQKPLPEMPSIKVETRSLMSDMECYLIVATNITKRTQLLQQALEALNDGYILSREPLDFDTTKDAVNGIEILTVHTTEKEKLVFLRKSPDVSEPATVKIPEDLNDFKWLENLHAVYGENKDVLLYSQSGSVNGIIGLVNCVRREPFGKQARCVFIDEASAPTFDLLNPVYQRQLRKGLAINVLKDNTWGTYRHLLLGDSEMVESEHCFANVLVTGDISSMRWIEGPLKVCDPVPPGKTFVHIYYAALNFKDVMMVTGKIHIDVITKVRTDQQIIQGIEFSGRDVLGNRVMGMMAAGAHANVASVDSTFVFPVPDKWTMKEAATVPVVYATVMCALLHRVKIERGKTILIHAGSGGIGQAAINICLYYGLKIFTTAGTKEKREFIKSTFPEIEDHQIGNSRDTTFEQFILKETCGRGVDYILNSLAEEKLLASVRCLAIGGDFLEIGKFDLVKNNQLPIRVFRKGGSFHSIMLDMYFDKPASTKLIVRKLILEGIENGSVKPIVSTVFKANEIDVATRYLASGKHIGKVLILVKDEESSFVVPKITPMVGIARYFCTPRNSYIITGGLGGFGLELADWLVLRGARKLVLTSRNGIKNGYQRYRTRIWRSYGVEVLISTANISTREGCKELIEEANELGPVCAIFNLAVILRDAIIENQTEESFRTSFGPKAFATKYLDEISRLKCPQLRDFVVFSSVSCGRGNAGQTNYGMANSIMERICEQRNRNGLPGLAIEWGAVGDVGLVAEMQKNHEQLEIAGTLQQRISSCLAVMGRLLKQNEPIVSSIVVAEKQAGLGADNIIEAIANIIGIRDIKTVSPYSTLSELGMDSMMSVEVKQMMERECQVFLPPAEIRGLTFAKLQELLEEKDHKEENGDTSADVLRDHILLNCVGDESLANCSSVSLPSRGDESNVNEPIVFLLPGIEGTASALRNLSNNLAFRVVCLQYSGRHQSAIEELAVSLLPQIKPNLKRNDTFRIISHSFGTLVAIELVKLLEAAGHTGKVIFIDGAPDFVQKVNRSQFNLESDATLETDVICGILSHHMPAHEIVSQKEKLLQSSSTEERIKQAFSFAPSEVLSRQAYLTQVIMEVFERIKAGMTFSPSTMTAISSFVLCRPTMAAVAGLKEDYGLADILGKKVQIDYFQGTHLSILDNLDLSEFVNHFLRECI